MDKGKVWLVGAGPGDIGLFTLKGMNVLNQADVVVYDSLVGQGVLAKVPGSARLINVGTGTDQSGTSGRSTEGQQCCQTERWRPIPFWKRWRRTGTSYRTWSSL